MDMNYLFRRHQIVLMRAADAACRSSRHSHLGLAAEYAKRIRELQVELGATVTPLQAA